MLANFFDKTKPINSIVLSFIFFSFYTIYRFQPEASTFTDFTSFEILTHLICNAFFLVICGLVFIKNGVSNDNLHNSFLMILLYGMFPNAFEINKTLGVAFLALLMYRNISQLKTKGKTQILLFDSGLIAGVSFLLFDWTILFLGFIYIGLFFSKKINFRTVVSPILGLITPCILYFTYCLFTNTTPDFYNRFEFLYSLDTSLYSSIAIKIPLIVVSIATGIAIVTTLPKVISISNSYRFQYLLLLIMLGTGLILIVISPKKNGSEFLYIFIPIAVILGKFINILPQKKLKEIFLIGLTLFSIISLWHQPG